MAQYNYFWDLENSQAYTNHTVKQLDANATTGGGSFKWVAVANNATIQNIPGIRIKPLNNIKGYWERDSEGLWLVDWFGCVNTAGQSTLSGYGLVAGDLAARFNCVTKDVNGNTVTPSNTIALTDTYDTAAMKLAFNLMELGYISSIQFLNKDYYISNTCNLPLAYYTATDRYTTPFSITGNASQIIVHSTKATTSGFIFWNRNVPTLGDANNQIHSRFVIDNFNFKGTSTTIAYSIGLWLKATTNSIISNVSFFKMLSGLILNSCPNTKVVNVETTDTQTSIRIQTGYTSLPSSNCTVDNFNCKFAGISPTTFSNGILVTDADGVEINNATMNVTAASGISAIELVANTPVSSFKVNKATLNINSTPTASQGIGINLIPYNTNVQIDNISNTTPCILIKANGLNSGTHNITVRNTNSIDASAQFENATTNNQWIFENCKTLNPLTAGRWYAGSQPVTGAWTADGPAAGSTVRLRESYPFYTR